MVFPSSRTDSSRSFHGVSSFFPIISPWFFPGFQARQWWQRSGLYLQRVHGEMLKKPSSSGDEWLAWYGLRYTHVNCDKNLGKSIPMSLVGRFNPTPLKIWVSWDDDIPNILWKNKMHVPNHQPVYQCHNPYAPCMVYLPDWVIFRVTVGKYSSTMEHLGNVTALKKMDVDWPGDRWRVKNQWLQA